MKHLLKIGLVLGLIASTLWAGKYRVDTDHSYVEFAIEHLGIALVKGEFDTFSGNFEYDEKSSTLKALKGEIEVASINTGVDKRDAHLRSDDFFAQATYPRITFTLTKVKEAKAYGKLTMRGVTKDVVLAMTQSKMVQDPWGNQRVGIALSGTINRGDFNINYNQTLKSGFPMIGQSVALEIQLEGILTK